MLEYPGIGTGAQMRSAAAPGRWRIADLLETHECFACRCDAVIYPRSVQEQQQRDVMRIFSRSEDTKPTRKVTEFFDRFGARGAAIILTAEVIWIASILVPVLTVIGLLFSFTNAWMSVLPGFIGALTFILVLAIGALAAAVPSNYVAKWRERVWRWMEDRHPEPRTMATPIFPPGLDIQDAD